MVGMVALHAGANIANDYFDHTSGNDWCNKNVTAFSGGSQLIQQGLLSPGSVLVGALVAFAIGGAIGVAILLITKSVFVLVLGLAGMLGGYFYTAWPIRLGYRCAGEIVIGLLFGLLPVYGAYYVQTGTIDLVPVVPGVIVGILIFLVILINEFPDASADGSVNKRTLVVVLGEARAAQIYRVVLLFSFAVAVVWMFVFENMVFAGVGYILTFPLALAALKSLKRDVLEKAGGVVVNQQTILLHLAGGLMLSAGLLVSGLMGG